jgi:hypothetical protein
MSDQSVIVAPVLDFGVTGDPDGEHGIVAVQTAFGGAAGLFTADQLTDFASQLLAWAAMAQPHHERRSTEPEMVVGRPIRVANLALGPADDDATVTLIVPVGPLRLQFIVQKRLIAGLIGGLARLDGMELPKPN